MSNDKYNDNDIDSSSDDGSTRIDQLNIDCEPSHTHTVYDSDESEHEMIKNYVREVNTLTEKASTNSTNSTNSSVGSRMDDADLDSDLNSDSSDDEKWGYDTDDEDKNSDKSPGEQKFTYTKLSNLVHNNKFEYKNIRNNRNIKNSKYKQLLCKNILQTGSCKYGSQCKYAHDISEQVMEDIYKKAYDVIQGNLDLTKINIYTDKELYKILLKLCDVCSDCERYRCPGGYNCRNGACHKKYVICRADLQDGKCKGNCGKIHLTDKGLKPLGMYITEKQKKKHNKYSTQNKSDIRILLTKGFFETNTNDLPLYSESAIYESNDLTFETSIFGVKI